MTTLEVIEDLTATPKWYIPHYSQQLASYIVKAIKNGTAKPSTIKKLFNRYGYVGEYNEWKYNNEFL